jgi:hypothetical protein
MSGVESPVPGPAGVNMITDNAGGRPGSVAAFATDATTSGQPGSVSGVISDTRSEATRLPRGRLSAAAEGVLHPGQRGRSRTGRRTRSFHHRRGVRISEAAAPAVNGLI